MDSSELYFSDICKYKVGDRVSLVRPVKSRDRHAYNFLTYKIVKIDTGTSRSLAANNIIKDETVRIELIDDNENIIRVGIGSIRPIDKVDLSYKEHVVLGYRLYRLYILILIIIGFLLIGVAFLCSKYGVFKLYSLFCCVCFGVIIAESI